MREPHLETILDECLQDMSTRGETIERCLQRYPRHAGQLAPLVQVADHIRKTSHPTLSVSVIKAIEQRLLERATELRQPRAKPGLWSLPFSFRPLVTVAATLVLVLALVLAGGGGIVYASTDSLPGSPLYGVKRATEQVQLFLAPAGTKRAKLHVKFAQRRLEEVQSLTEIEGQVDEETLAAIAEETELALEETEKAPAQDKSVLLYKLVSLTERQQKVLERVQEKAPEAAKKGLSRALEASQRGHKRAKEALQKEKPGRDVKPTHTPKPTKTPKPTHTPKPTKTPKPALRSGVHDQVHGPPSTPPDRSGGVHGPPATPPGKSGEKKGKGPGETGPPGKGKDKDNGNGPPAESPGEGEDKDTGGGPPVEPPGQDKKDKGSGGGGGGGGKAKGK